MTSTRLAVDRSTAWRTSARVDPQRRRSGRRNRDVAARTAAETGHHRVDLGLREHGRHVHPDARPASSPMRAAARPSLFVTGILTNTLSPHARSVGLASHLGELVGEHLERDRLAVDHLQGFHCELLVVVDARRSHECRVRREPAGSRRPRGRSDAGDVGAVGEHLHRQVGNGRHGCVLLDVRSSIHATASASSPTRQIGVVRVAARRNPGQ